MDHRVQRAWVAKGLGDVLVGEVPLQYGVAGLLQNLDQVAADEPGGAGNQDSHIKQLQEICGYRGPKLAERHSL